MPAKVKKDRIDGTDRWTSKGYGIKVAPQTAEQKAQIARLNKELDAKKAKKPAAKKPAKKG